MHVVHSSGYLMQVFHECECIAASCTLNLMPTVWSNFIIIDAFSVPRIQIEKFIMLQDVRCTPNDSLTKLMLFGSGYSLFGDKEHLSYFVLFVFPLKFYHGFVRHVLNVSMSCVSHAFHMLLDVHFIR